MLGMELILEPVKNRHVSRENMVGFERAILSDSRLRPLNASCVSFSDSVYYLWRFMDEFRRRKGSSLGFPLPVLRLGVKGRDLFAVSIGLNVRKFMPFYFSAGRKSIYLLDAWPAVHDRLGQFIRHLNIDPVFLSSSQAVERLRRSVPGSRFYWLPEGTDPARYRFALFPEKDIDVLQFGRKSDAYHRLVVAPLEDAGRVYLYEKVKGEIIFQTEDDFIDGLARSKVSVCFPSSMTHPERSGDIETLTARYLQSMVAKCLVVGHAPPEMVELFGYNPVIEVDWGNPVAQLLHILDHYSDHLPFIEQNYQEVVANHSWQRRWEQIAPILFP
jgi:hypothetical protein